MPPLRLRRRLILAALGPGMFLLFQLLSRTPGLVEGLYASAPGPMVVRVLTWLTGWTSLALVEVVVLALVARHLWTAITAFRSVRTGGEPGRRALAGWSLRLLADAGVLAALFYLLWGFNYARPTLEARLGWEEVRSPGVEELRALATEAVEETNRWYVALHGTEDTGAPTPQPRDATERVALHQGLLEGWRQAEDDLAMDGLGADLGPVKTLFLGRTLFFRLGLLGMYMPFTAEPLVNGLTPGSLLPRTMAHEQAHQRGIAPEDEANFMALMSMLRSSHPQVRYSAWAYAQRRLLVDLSASDSRGAQELARLRHPGVRRDERNLNEFLQSMAGPVNRVAEQVNDAYLRSNRVEGGIRSYGLVTRLLVAYARQNEGSLSGPAPHPTETGGGARP